MKMRHKHRVDSAGGCAGQISAEAAPLPVSLHRSL
jgi:hypothetical protein